MRRLALLLVLVAAACTETDPIRLYILPPAPERGTPGGGFEGQVVGLSTLTLPQYAEESRLTVLGAGLTAVQLDDDRWAVALPDAATQVLAQALAQRTGATVLAEPWPVETRADMRIDVLADRFVGRSDGSVEFSGEFRISHPRLRGDVLAQRFAITVPASGVGLEGLAAGHAVALAGLADQLAETLAATF